MTRRGFLGTTGLAILMGRTAWAKDDETFEVMRSEAEWKAMLSPLDGVDTPAERHHNVPDSVMVTLSK